MTDIVLLTTNSKKENYSITSNKYSAIPPNIPLLITEAYLSSKGYDVKIMDTETYPKSMFRFKSFSLNYVNGWSN